MTSDTTREGPPPYRYTAALADQIEWPGRTDGSAKGRSTPPTRSGRSARGSTRPREALRARHVPVPVGEGLHVGHPLGLHRHRRLRPIPADARRQRAAHDGLRRLRAAGGAVRGADRPAPAATTTEATSTTFRRQLRRLGLGHDQRRGVATTDAGYYRWTQWIFLQIFNSWYDDEAGRARPIAELVAELDFRHARAGAGHQPVGRAVGGARRPSQRREVVDNHRLAYLAEAPVNWCPGLGTVLANEEVTADGRSERGNSRCFGEPLKQWMMRITAYADRLLDDLDLLDWPESVQARCSATGSAACDRRARCDSPSGPTDDDRGLHHPARHDVRRDLHGAGPGAPAGRRADGRRWPDDTDPTLDRSQPTPAEAVTAYQAAAARKSELDRQAEDKREDRRLHRRVRDEPGNGEPIPVFIADYVLMGYGTGAIMAVPGQDERDWEFAEVFGLPIVRTVRAARRTSTGKAYLGDGPAINSATTRFPGRPGRRRRPRRRSSPGWSSTAAAGRRHLRLRDWLFTRQRYWGEPFPIVYDETGLPIAAAGVDAAGGAARDRRLLAAGVRPDDADSEPEPPLGRLTDWVDGRRSTWATARSATGARRTRCRNWAGSCWYELRYLDPTNDEQLRRPRHRAVLDGAAPRTTLGGVDLYVGGVEHAVLHLLYARFWHKVLYDLGHVSSARAVPPTGQPGLRPGLRVHRLPRLLRPGRGGGGGARRRGSVHGDGEPVTASTARWARA